jgi:DHA1 family tetracycline resistance protein-like MFS transporter
MISKRQIAALFVCSMIPYLMGNAQISLLPLYLQRLGADPSSNGLSLAVIELALAAGTFSSGWIANRVGRHKQILAGAALFSFPFSFLMSEVTNINLLLLLLGVGWFLGGLALGILNILVGMMAGENERGKVFGILGLSAGVGTMIGAVMAGNLVEHWDFPTMFKVVACAQLLLPLAALQLNTRDLKRSHPQGVVRRQPWNAMGGVFFVLMTIGIIVNGSTVVAAFGRPLLMDQTRFDANSIASVSAFAGAVSIPVPLIVGWLSDRIGRYRLLILCCLMVAFSVALHALASSLWHFWAVAAIGTGNPASIAILSALVTDLAPADVLEKSLAWVVGGVWLGGVVGFLFTGYVVEQFGLTISFLLGGALPLLGVLLLVVMRSALHPRASRQESVL